MSDDSKDTMSPEQLTGIHHEIPAWVGEPPKAIPGAPELSEFNRRTWYMTQLLLRMERAFDERERRADKRDRLLTEKLDRLLDLEERIETLEQEVRSLKGRDNGHDPLDKHF